MVMMALLLVLVSACDVYDTLYIKKAGSGAKELPESAPTNFEPEVTDGQMVEVKMETEAPVEKANAAVIMVEETELVSLQPKAEDPDNDALLFTFTSPLDENGGWQTNYGDAGEYTITVTASDGTLTSSKEILIIVNKKEEAPVLESFSPAEDALELDETESMQLAVSAKDLNDDALSYSWKLDGTEVGVENSYQYQTTHEDAGSHTVKVSVSDGASSAERIWAVKVNNVNRAPEMKEIIPIEVNEMDKVVLNLDAADPDWDELKYSISDSRFSQEGNTFTWETTYDDAGSYEITVTASDGMDTVAQQVLVEVKNVNRAPVILDIVQK